jgi:COP9 signalosome complex subunit 1
MQGSYKDAAVSFINVGPGYMTPDAQAGIVFQRAVLTPNDVAVYGGLCALATMDRSELQRRVLENSSFRQFLELEPHIRRAISLFCASKYTACMEILESYQVDYMLDYFLQNHFMRLYWMVRSKSIVQWFSAFSVVTLDELAKAFPATQGRRIVDELVDMIRAGQLDARIDLVENLLICPNQDPRFAAMENALDIAKQAERSLRLKLHKVNMAAAGLELRPPKGQMQNGSEFFVGTEGGGSGAGHALRNLKGKFSRGSSGVGGSFMV